MNRRRRQENTTRSIPSELSELSLERNAKASGFQRGCCAQIFFAATLCYRVINFFLDNVKHFIALIDSFEISSVNDFADPVFARNFMEIHCEVLHKVKV